MEPGPSPHAEADDPLPRIHAAAVVPVLVVDDEQAASPLGDALIEAGLHCAEVTLRTEAALSILRRLADRPGLLAGAGTVLEPSQVDQAVEAGARFIVAPGLDPRVVERCQELGVPVLPGVATAGEVLRARRYGLRAAKFFPAEQAGGLPLLRALAPAIPGFTFVPTGGIGAHNAASYLSQPMVLAVGGSWMAPGDVLARRDWTQLRELCAGAGRIAAARAGGLPV